MCLNCNTYSGGDRYQCPHPLPRLLPVLDAMSEIGMPLLVHGEVSSVSAPGVDIFDREKVFLQQVLRPLRRLHPHLKVRDKEIKRFRHAISRQRSPLRAQYLEHDM